MQYIAPTTPDNTIPFFPLGQKVPMISVPSNILCTKIIDAAIDTGIPKPITSPKLIAKEVAAKAFLFILPSKNSGTIALKPSLKTAICCRFIC